ncbi:MAG: AMP-binding protein [Bacteroidales bacterium]|nr:AMP-binding protein [Bacteroidales bacterium]
MAQSPNRQIAQSPNRQIALLQYTSGSTGRPKGVMVTHHNLMRNLEFLRQAVELTPDSISVHWLPVFHDMGLVFGVLESIYTGYTGILMPPVSFIQKPSRWLKAITRYKATLAGAPNFAYDLCVADISEDECKDLDLSSLKSLYNGAEPVRASTMKAFTGKFGPFGFREEMFYPTYGMAEATLMLSGGKVCDKPVVVYVDKTELEKNRIRIVAEENENAYSLVSVGNPWIDTSITIVNPDTLEPCPGDVVGELWVSGSIVTKGYWENDEETRNIFNAYTASNGRGPFLRTGDLGFFHEGKLYISGRLKDLIIIRGSNYYPQDIEYLAENSHNAIRANCSAAFSVIIDDTERLIIVAEVERTAMKDLNVEEVVNAIRTKIAGEMELAVYGIQLIRTATIMKTSSGKIQRKACQRAFLSHSLEVVGESFLTDYKEDNDKSISPPDLVAIRAWLMTWIHLKLKIRLEKIDLSKPITVYGLNSMKAVQLQQDFLENFQVNFPPYLFFERISLNELSERALRLIKESEK